ncbi:pol polyprotein [Pseudoloma neurophilia]|uniref:Pol polyprotein n=1 Tax=Pseudoloma neurophilia TaxID=146866 RepID=A0A0R0M7W8_9MICR|nr:pol polyprotein [Pseudoloma neurophilia]
MFKFAEIEELVFKQVKEDIQKCKSLNLPDLKDKFIIYTDASSHGIGAALTQEVDGNVVVVQWASRRLLLREANYTVTEKECLSVVWALEKFKYFLGDEIIVHNDHQALKWLLSIKEPQNRLARWVMRLSEFNYRLEYISGRENCIVDILSRGLLRDKKPTGAFGMEMETPHALSEHDKQEIITYAHEITGHAKMEVVMAQLKQYTSLKNMKQDVQQSLQIVSFVGIMTNRNRTLQNIEVGLMVHLRKLGLMLLIRYQKSDSKCRAQNVQGVHNLQKRVKIKNRLH